MELPAWFAFTLQVPTVRNETTEPDSEQTDEADASIVRTTEFPEPPPVVVTEYVEPPTVALGADDVMVTT